jgi:hypothetical protein
MAGHWGHVEEDAARLAAALERLARLRPAGLTPEAGRGTADLARRLDALIAELRGVLGKEAAD